MSLEEIWQAIPEHPFEVRVPLHFHLEVISVILKVVLVFEQELIRLTIDCSQNVVQGFWLLIIFVPPSDLV